MKLRMKQLVKASPDRINIFLYEQGEVYDRETTPRLDPLLEEIFLAQGWAEEVQDAPAPAAPSSAEAPAPTPAPAPEKEKSPKGAPSAAPANPS